MGTEGSKDGARGTSSSLCQIRARASVRPGSPAASIDHERRGDSRALEIARSADAAVMMSADDAHVSWASLLAVVILCWLGIALAVGTIVGHGIAFGTGSHYE
jgi:hypothetical protein